MSTTSTMHAQDVVLFEASGGRYAFPATSVVEYLDRESVTPLPGLRPEVDGLIAFRKHPVPVIDLDVWAGRDPGEGNERLLVFLVGPDEMAALAIGRVLGMESLTTASFTHHADGTTSAFVDGGEVPYLDIDSFLAAGDARPQHDLRREES